MRYLALFVASVALLVTEVALASASAPAFVRTQNTAQEKAATLRAQLSEVETKQAALQTRLQKLEEDLKPENIEQNLAGIGSTRPEDLREQRRRQLEIERNGVQRQLDLLATSHTRLETAIAQTETEAYRQSAAPVNVPVTTTTPATAESTSATTTPAPPRRVKRKKARRSKRQHHAQTVVRFAG
jgi:Skp family chaperone for outer membrane proteins